VTIPLPARIAAFAAALVLAGAAARAQALEYPPTPKKPVTDTYDGVKVTDDYRWLENGDDPEVKAWSAAQTKLTRSFLDALPVREELARQFREIYSAEPVRYYRFRQRGAFFAMKRQPPKNQPLLVVMKSAGDVASERVIVDPNRIDAQGTTAIDFYAPSLDGRYVAVALSEKGSEQGPAYVYEVATGKRLPDVVPRVQYPTGGGSIEWDVKATGFYYTRYPQGEERPPEDRNFYQQVYFHKLGTPASQDRYVIGKEFPRIAETVLQATRDGRHLLATVANGDGGEFSFYLRDPAGKWTRVAQDADKVRAMELGFDGRIYALSLKDAPRGKILMMPMADARLAAAKVVVPEGEATIEAVDATRSRLYVTYMVGGPSELRVFDLAGKPLAPVPTEPVSTVGVGERLGGDDILVGSQSYVTAPAWYRYSPRTSRLEKTALAGESKVRFDDAEVVREMATSKDGTRVPLNILMRKGTKRDGSNPVLLYGYGGYGVSERPYFSVSNRIWLDHGGVFAVANLRGGGEFGEAWHRAGNLTKKQNVFDDFAGVLKHLIEKKYTSSARLGIEGGSNGGLLMGATLTQHPELVKAVVSHVGIYDMLRVELSPNGAFNVPEFGTVKDPDQFKALFAYSPYHNVKDRTKYPAILFMTGANDPRVDPMQSRKMAACLQAATASDAPILLRTSDSSGHGIGTSLSERIDELTDAYAFFFEQLGVKGGK
jgi:prolyl oligopeptidase